MARKTFSSLVLVLTLVASTASTPASNAQNCSRPNGCSDEHLELLQANALVKLAPEEVAELDVDRNGDDRLMEIAPPQAGKGPSKQLSREFKEVPVADTQLVRGPKHSFSDGVILRPGQKPVGAKVAALPSPPMGAHQDGYSGNYILMNGGVNTCHPGYKVIGDEGTCKKAMTTLGLDPMTTYAGKDKQAGNPGGCFKFDMGLVHLNNDTGEGNVGSRKICEKDVEIGVQGMFEARSSDGLYHPITVVQKNEAGDFSATLPGGLLWEQVMPFDIRRVTAADGGLSLLNSVHAKTSQRGEVSGENHHVHTAMMTGAIRKSNFMKDVFVASFHSLKSNGDK